MSQLFEALSQTLAGGTTERLSERLDADPDATRRAVAAAVPVLIGALQRNTAQPGGADALAAALERDHDGSLIDSLGGLLGGLQGGSGGGLGGLGAGLGGLLESLQGGGRPVGGSPKALDGGGILDHVLGRRRPQVEEGIGKASGLDAAKVGQLLKLLAPLVMAYLGRAKRQDDLGPGGLRDLLERETRDIETKADLGGAGRSSSGGLLGSLLDRDGDGQVIDDIAEIGGALAKGGALGKIFGR